MDQPIILYQSGQYHYVQDKAEELTIYILCIDSADIDIEVEQVAEGCSVTIYGLCYINNKESARVHTHVRHLTSKTQSKQLIKFVLNDEAKGEFFGELFIAKDAQHIDAQQTNRNILLSHQASMRTRPQLIIYADDVKASHGATTGQLDENALFYMQQRGISKSTAQQLLLQAFVKDVLPLSLDGISEHIQERLLSLGMGEEI